MTTLNTDPQVHQPPAISLAQVAKSFPGGESGARVHAVRGVDLDIQPGEIVAFLGPNGAGKTTTLDMMLGLTVPDSGTVSVLGLTPRQAVSAGRVSAVLQSGGLLRDLSVRETVRMMASTFPQHSDVDDVIERAGLTGLQSRKVSKCSGGEQQRLRFALALLPDPDVLILDEPTAGMDVSARRDFWASMHAEAEHGRTVVFATHYLEEADAFADRIVLIARGTIVADGSTQQIRSRATGRTVCADLPAGSNLSLIAQNLRGMPGVGRVDTDGQRITVRSSDSDTVARLMLTELGGHDVEITAGSLETAFMTITADTPEEARA
ncbi:MAG: ABC transporter ATP-binding protein [Ornithinimicrobium sp.]